MFSHSIKRVLKERKPRKSLNKASLDFYLPIDDIISFICISDVYGVAFDDDCGIRILGQTSFKGLYLGEGLAVIERNGEGQRSSDSGDSYGIVGKEYPAAVIGVKIYTAVVVRQVGCLCSAPGLAAVKGVTPVYFAELCSGEHMDGAVLGLPKRGLNHGNLEEA